MINKQFVEETDRLIEKFKTRNVGCYNGNLIVAKVKADEVTAGGLIIPKQANEIKDFHNGLARIVAVADNADAQYKPGLYVIHSHESRYKIFEEALRELLDYPIEKNLLYAVQDSNVILTISQDEMHK